MQPYRSVRRVRAAVYVRISRDKAGLALGVERQREDCEDLVRSRGWQLVEVFTDNDISATKGRRRPGYVDMMSHVAAGKIDRVVVYMTSRLWRSRRDRLDGMELFQRHGVGLVPVRGPELDFSSASGRLIANLLGEMDTVEVEIKSERAKREVRQRAERGAPLGGPKMFGVAADGRTLVEDEAEQIRRWYDLILAGGSITSIRRESGKHHASIGVILRNPRNAGLRVLDGVTYPASNPAIVPETTWRAVQAILNDPRRRTTRSVAHRWFGAGLYQCSECHRPVKTSYTTHGKVTARTYACQRIEGGCGRAWRAEPIDAFVTEIVAGWLVKYGGRLPRRDASPSGDLASEAAGIRKRLEQIGAEFAADDIDMIEFRTARLDLRARLADAEARMVAAGHTSALDALLASDEPVATWLAMRDARRQKSVIGALMTVDLLPSRHGRPPKNWDPEWVVKVGWRDLNAEI